MNLEALLHFVQMEGMTVFKENDADDGKKKEIRRERAEVKSPTSKIVSWPASLVILI